MTDLFGGTVSVAGALARTGAVAVPGAALSVPLAETALALPLALTLALPAPELNSLPLARAFALPEALAFPGPCLTALALAFLVGAIPASETPAGRRRLGGFRGQQSKGGDPGHHQ